MAGIPSRLVSRDAKGLSSRTYIMLFEAFNGFFIQQRHSVKRMFAFKALFALASLLGSVSAVPAPIPIGGVDVRRSDPSPLYHTVSDCTFLGDRSP